MATRLSARQREQMARAQRLRARSLGETIRGLRVVLDNGDGLRRLRGISPAEWEAATRTDLEEGEGA